MNESRSEPREARTGRYTLTWKAADGKPHSIEAVGLDISRSGIGVECPIDLRLGAIVSLEARDGSIECDCEVIHCARRGAAFRVGLEFREGWSHRAGATGPKDRAEGEPDYYEILQISRKADIETIHRVFRIMAMRFHPDNSETGDLETFLRMKRAYAVLSDPALRSQYDATLEEERESGPHAIFGLKDFVTGVEAEANRRLGVLCLLYTQRQTDPEHPAMSILKLEDEMGFPREYLNFTMWYLRAKELVTAADNADYVITAQGADHVEKEAEHSDIVGRLLKPGGRGGRPARKAKERSGREAESGRRLLVTPSPRLPNVN